MHGNGRDMAPVEKVYVFRGRVIACQIDAKI